MGAPLGNQFWKARTKHGRDLLFKTPDVLWDACCEYFQWNEDNPLWEEKLFAYKGDVTKDVVYKLRAMTIEGLCMFLDIDLTTWINYKGREDFFHVITRAEDVIRRQKFEGAAAELLNANIIARDLGLKDVSSSEHTGKDGGPIKYEETPPDYSALSTDELRTLRGLLQKAQDARASKSES